MKNMPEREAISNFLKKYRQINHETQYEFAANTGICVEELSKLERKIGNPSLGTLQKIVAYTGNTVSELVYVERYEVEEEMFQALLEEYHHSERCRNIEESEIYFEISKPLEQFLSAAEYLEYEEKLNDFLALLTQDAFLAGCEAVWRYGCTFYIKPDEGTL